MLWISLHLVFLAENKDKCIWNVETISLGVISSVLSSSTLVPKASVFFGGGGLKYFKLSLLNSSPDATAVPEESRLVPHRWVLPRFRGALQLWRLLAAVGSCASAHASPAPSICMWAPWTVEVLDTTHHALRSACSAAYTAGVALQRDPGRECGDRFELSGTCHSREVIHPHGCRIWLDV